MGAPNFNLAPKFLQNGGFIAQNFVFFKENFRTRKFSDSKAVVAGTAMAVPIIRSNLCAVDRNYSRENISQTALNLVS